MDIGRIDEKRLEAGISVESLCGAAGYSSSNYRKARRGLIEVKKSTLRSFAQALSMLSAAPEDLARYGLGLFVVYLPLAALVAREINVDMRKVRENPAGRRATASLDWREAARVRELATYLMNVSLGIPQAALARMHNITPAAICQMMRKIEAQREADRWLDRMLDRLEGDIGVET